jgi:hypothetical protein
MTIESALALILDVSFVVLLFGFAAPRFFNIQYRSITAKNPAWISAHPEIGARLSPPKASIWLSYAVGALLLGLIGYFLAIGWTDLRAIDAMTLPNVTWICLLLGYAALQRVRIGSNIPLPDKRNATLERRNIGEFVNPAWIFAGYGLLAAILGAYIYAFSNHMIEAALFQARSTGMAGIILITAVVLRVSVRRKRSVIDEAWGTAYRKLEMHLFVIVLFAGAGVGLWRLSQDLLHLQSVDDMAVFIGTNLMTQAMVLFFYAHPATKKLLTGK